jgi:hypothetical protein
MDTKKSAHEVAIKNPAYFTWLHDLTTTGYEQNIIIPAEHSEGVAAIFLTPLEGVSPIERYIDFSKRMKALNEHSL